MEIIKLEQEVLSNKKPLDDLLNAWGSMELKDMAVSLRRVKKELNENGKWVNWSQILINTEWWINFCKRKDLWKKLDDLHEEEKNKEEF
ncbi:MAG: hypothetical protein WCK31_04965 [bacterium]